jgi:hypothetical protein
MKSSEDQHVYPAIFYRGEELALPGEQQNEGKGRLTGGVFVC